MAPSPIDAATALTKWREHLDAIVTADPEAMVAPDDQLAIEDAIAVGVSVLAGETSPPEAATSSERRILARDLRITTDLVLRALQAHS